MTSLFAPMETRGWTEERCLCLKCSAERRNAEQATLRLPSPHLMDFRYACKTCGCKRCPHHSDHALACTGSNEPGQPGSVY